jgi:hypothetical protein
MIGPNGARCGAPVRARARLRRTIRARRRGLTSISGETFEFDVEVADTPK